MPEKVALPSMSQTRFDRQEDSTNDADALIADLKWAGEQLSLPVSDGDTLSIEAQQCAANIISLLMCTASASSSSVDLEGLEETSNPSGDQEGAHSSFISNEVLRNPAEAKAFDDLQIRINRNIQKLGSRPLNTMEIARQCKRLMITHNIGQRLFAKYIMNQVVKSQGSLSELLAKPRHWSKLTDKGREAFRRIYGWISDERAIEILCSLSPRRIQSSGAGRIEAPLPETLWETVSTEISTLRSRDQGQTTEENELHVKASEESATRNSSRNIATCSTNSNNSGGGSSRSSSRWRHDDIPKEKIITIFQTELAKLREQESHLERAIASRPCSSVDVLARPKEEKKPVNNSLKKLEELTEHSPLPAPLTTLANAALCTSPCSSTASSASITVNSSNLQLALRCRSGTVPITQEQLERYAVLDTEEVVRQIKEYLCSNSISQRQFGEHVLGLSQGSVSDLLARPKPWSMLTQKGREPFIRMQLFLNEAARLSRESSTTSERFHNIDKTYASVNVPLPNASENVDDSSLDPKTIAAEGLLEMKNSAVEEGHNEESFGVDVNQRRVTDNESPRIDTTELSKRVLEVLASSGLSYKSFSESVLGVDGNTGCELLTQPKSWSALSQDDRKLFMKISEWLDDPDNIVKLKKECIISDAMNASIQRALQAVCPLPTALQPNNSQSQSKILTSVEAHLKNKNSVARKRSTQNASEPVKKSQRTVISDQQKEALKFVFEHDQHPSQRTVEQLSEKLALNPRTVSNWFHNYRTRQKAHLKDRRSPAANGDIHGKHVGKTNGWQRVHIYDLSDLLEMASKPLPPNLWSPTMVSRATTKKASTFCDPCDNSQCGDSQLDKAIARMQQIAAAKQK